MSAIEEIIELGTDHHSFEMTAWKGGKTTNGVVVTLPNGVSLLIDRLDTPPARFLTLIHIADPPANG